METTTSGTSLDYSVNKSTISSNNKITASTDTSSNQSLTNKSNNETKTETLDLSGETEQKESKGLFGSILDGLKGIGENLAETAANVADNVKSIANDAKNWVVDAGKKVAATGAVIGTSVVSGVGKLVEKAADGIEWVGGKVVEGGAWVAGQVAGAFSDEAKEDIDNWREDFSKAVKEDIAIDTIGELNKEFYENTEVGRWINENSAIKYDSKVAQTIQSGTEIVAEVAAATALTVCTGGAAAPFVVGALVGAGKAAESTYQEHGTDTTFLQELGIAGSGALTGLTWVANGKLGQGALEIGKDIIAKGGATVLKDMGAQMLNKEFIFSRLKDGLSLKNAAGKVNINAIMNYGQAAMGTAGSLTPYITGEEKFDATAALKIGGTYLGYLGLNVLEDTARDYVSGYKSADTLAQAAEKLTSEVPVAASKVDEVPDPVSANEPGIRMADEFDLQTIKRNVAVQDSGLTIYNKGINLDATAHQVPIDLLLRVANDPDYAAKVLDGDLLEEVDGLSRLEIGNALKDLRKAAERYNLDLGLDEAGLARMDDCIQKLSRDPMTVIIDLTRKMSQDPAAQKWDWDYFSSEDGKKMVQYLKNIDASGASVMLPDGYYASELLDFYRGALYNGVLNREIIPDQDQFLEVAGMLLQNDNISNTNVRILEDLMNTHGYHLYGEYGTTLGEYIKRANLEDVEGETIRRLRAFSAGYVADGKVDSIYGSCRFETSAQFAQGNHGTAMAFNNGTESVMSLGYPEEILRANVNHESIHQISTWSGIDPSTQTRVYRSGVREDVWDRSKGAWIKSREGINECITEFFNKISMGSDFPTDTHYCGYADGVEKLEQLVNTGIISVDELKRFYFGNDGAGLVKLITDRTSRLGFRNLGDEIASLLDGAISNDNSIRPNALNGLTQIIIDLESALENGANISKGKGFMSILRGLFH